MTNHVHGLWLFVALAAVLFSGCNTTPKTAERRMELHDQVTAAIVDFKQKDPDLQRFFDNCYGYALLPSVGQGGLIVGGAYGHGEVYRHMPQGDQLIGHCNMSQGTVGAQAGGQSFNEIIFFENKGSFEAFTSDQWAFDAAASAVAASAGASATADYKKGVVVFTKAQGGLMLQAAIGGQKFNFVSDVQTTDVRP